MKSFAMGLIALLLFNASLLTGSCFNRLANDNAKPKKDYAMVKNLVSFEYIHNNGSMIYRTPEYTGSMDYAYKVERDKEGRCKLNTSRWDWSGELKMVHDSIVLPDTTVRKIVEIVNSCQLYKMPSYIEVDPEYIPLDAGAWSATLQVDTFSTSLNFGDGGFPVRKADNLYVHGVQSIVAILKNFLE